ncbi:prepilin peptidase-dependent protein [Kosakonia oryziphila]|uniref:Prepilin peptidase dependent protein A n=1 Tax=Kosakonia oryziphila TaxID=1005667 RepID=A0A1C4AG67_9ENTR|nr:prepilin peptidase-dependent protein [Kosakonia oryziphila]SCB93481.1 prepilin peptidase dependent protein A [Kosakonia oryziphila]
MKNEAGFTLIETLITVALIAILSGMGISGWQHWQAQQRLWQTALHVRHFLERLREEANWHNQAQRVYSVREGEGWCLLNTPSAGCATPGPLAVMPDWPEVTLLEVTPSLGFFGLRNTAWPGHIRVRSSAGEWRIVVSVWGRIRMCQNAKDDQC